MRDEVIETAIVYLDLLDLIVEHVGHDIVFEVKASGETRRLSDVMSTPGDEVQRDLLALKTEIERLRAENITLRNAIAEHKQAVLRADWLATQNADHRLWALIEPETWSSRPIDHEGRDPKWSGAHHVGEVRALIEEENVVDTEMGPQRTDVAGPPVRRNQ